MRVWIDLSNSPHPLFFAPLARRLEERGADVLITAREHAQTIELARELFPQTVLVVGGRSPAGRLRKAASMMGRIGALARWARRSRPDVALSHNSYGQLTAGRLLGIPSVTAMDFEYQPVNHVAFRAADVILMPEALPANVVRRQGATQAKVVRYAGLKEELYLGEFAPNANVLGDIGLGSRGDRPLVVARTAPEGAVYHRGENPILSSILRRLEAQPEVACVVLARHPEQRQAIAQLDLRNCLVPEGAVDSRSLLYQADLFIGAGGTMTREAALLGVPTYSVFAGRRPAVDRWLEQRGLLRHIAKADQLPPVSRRDRADVSLEGIRERGRRLQELFLGAIERAARGEGATG